MPRHDDRYGNTTRLYVGHLSSRTRSRDLEDVFRRYGRVRDVDMKRDYAFVEFSDPRDADDARYGLNGRDVDGSRIIVEHAKGVPRGPGGSREHLGRGPTPGTGRCFNCGNEGHWARDCKAGDWKNKCYHCGERGHIEKNCQNSPKKLGRKRSYSRSPSPRHGRIRRRSYSRSPSHSRSRSPLKRERSIEHGGRSRSASPLPSKAKKHSPMPARNSRERVSPSLSDGREVYEYDSSPDERIGSPKEDVEQNQRPKGRSPVEENGRSHSISPRDNGSPIDDGSPRRSPVEENGRSHSISPRDNGSPIDDGSPRGSD